MEFILEFLSFSFQKRLGFVVMSEQWQQIDAAVELELELELLELKWDCRVNGCVPTCH